MKKILLISWLVLIASAISYLFWHNEWKYSQPTPVPLNYHLVNKGTQINIAALKKMEQRKPVFLHFFNPDCPCSRFNIAHFKYLVKQYGKDIRFVVVVENSKISYSAKAIQDKFDLTIPILFDQSIAPTCGVYSTPQAVLLDADRKLFYRGNYNRTRYCTDKKTNYAEMAIGSLLNNSINPLFVKGAIKSYGCELLANTNN